MTRPLTVILSLAVLTSCGPKPPKLEGSPLGYWLVAASRGKKIDRHVWISAQDGLDFNVKEMGVDKVAVAWFPMTEACRAANRYPQFTKLLEEAGANLGPECWGRLANREFMEGNPPND